MPYATDTLERMEAILGAALPSDVEAERLLLGAMLLGSHADILLPMKRLRWGMFFDTEYALIFRELRRLHLSGTRWGCARFMRRLTRRLRLRHRKVGYRLAMLWFGADWFEDAGLPCQIAEFVQRIEAAERRRREAVELIERLHKVITHETG